MRTNSSHLIAHSLAAKGRHKMGEWDVACVASMVAMGEETEVVGVADGGKGIRDGLEDQFPGMQFVLDKSHLKKHLYETSEALGHKENHLHQWVHSKLDKISAGNVQRILEALVTQNADEPNDRVRQFVGYLTGLSGDHGDCGLRAWRPVPRPHRFSKPVRSRSGHPAR